MLILKLNQLYPDIIQGSEFEISLKFLAIFRLHYYPIIEVEHCK